MIANYHTHTWRCNHASNREEDYVRAALQNGMKTLGFSDHTPYYFEGDYYSNFRMKREQLPDYADTVRALRKQYKGQIDIHLGVECEYYPKHFADTLALLRDNGIEYLILGQHFIRNEYDAPYGGRPTDQEAQLAQYCRQTMEAMNTGLFTYFAHPDLLNFAGSEKVYMQYMREICREAKSCGIPLEINHEGIRRNRWYPNPLFLEVAAEENCPMVIGCDAHYADALNEPETEAKALKLAKDFGLTVLETVELRSIL